MECVNRVVAKGAEVWRMLLLRGILLEVADIVMNQQVRLDLVHVHDRLEETHLVLVVLVLDMLHGSKDRPNRGIHCKSASRQFAEGERPG